MNAEESREYLKNIASSKNVDRSSKNHSSQKIGEDIGLPSIHKPVLTHGIGNEEDLGFTKANVRIKFWFDI